KGSKRAWFQGIAVSPAKRPVKVAKMPGSVKGPIPLTISPELYGKEKERYLLTALFRLEITVASNRYFYLLTVGQRDPKTSRRKISFRELAN
ncbi:hypothetical protein IJS98_03040, partial [bacterium]|nr:hypothetical protein [bacterium]